MPKKEINFFSRPRNWDRGFAWYEQIFAECPGNARVGEFSTSYLSDEATPGRIHDRYPKAKLIVSLRDPVERAHSSYLNDIVAGVVTAQTPFDEALRSHPEYVLDGRYALHLRPYLDLFGRDQVLISIFEDARRDPRHAIQALYRFVEVDPSFEPAMLDRRVGSGRVPRAQWAERVLLSASAKFRSRQVLRPVWWTAKRLGVGDRLRRLNTRHRPTPQLSPGERRSLMVSFENDIRELEEMLQRPLPEWRS